MSSFTVSLPSLSTLLETMPTTIPASLGSLAGAAAATYLSGGLALVSSVAFPLIGISTSLLQESMNNEHQIAQKKQEQQTNLETITEIKEKLEQLRRSVADWQSGNARITLEEELENKINTFSVRDRNTFSRDPEVRTALVEELIVLVKDLKKATTELDQDAIRLLGDLELYIQRSASKRQVQLIAPPPPSLGQTMAKFAAPTVLLSLAAYVNPTATIAFGVLRGGYSKLSQSPEAVEPNTQPLMAIPLPSKEPTPRVDMSGAGRFDPTFNPVLAPDIKMPLSFLNKPLPIGHGSRSIAVALQSLANIPYLMKRLPEMIEAHLNEPLLFTDKGAAQLARNARQQNSCLSEAKQQALLQIANKMRERNRLGVLDLTNLKDHFRTITKDGLNDIVGLGRQEQSRIYKQLVLLELFEILQKGNTGSSILHEDMEALYSAVRKANPDDLLFPEDSRESDPRKFLESLYANIDGCAGKIIFASLKGTKEIAVNNHPEAIILQTNNPTLSLEPTIKIKDKLGNTKKYEIVAISYNEGRAYGPHYQADFVQLRKLENKKPCWHRYDNTTLGVKEKDPATNINVLGRNLGTQPYLLVAVPKS